MNNISDVFFDLDRTLWDFDYNAHKTLIDIYKNFNLQELNIDDVSRNYVKWLNDYSVVRFTEQKFHKHTIKSVKKFVIEKKRKRDEFLLGIFLSNKKTHVGNIKLGPINFKHKYAEISYFIGEKKFQNLEMMRLTTKKLEIKIATRVIQF